VLTPDELSGFFGACDVQVVPSLNSTESFGLVAVDLDVVYVKGVNEHLITEDGREILDVAQGAGTGLLGHNHPEIVATLQAVLSEQAPQHAQLSIRPSARRLIERGVRFVQVWSGADNGFPRRNWDSHEDLARDHGVMGRSLDKPAAALLKDLKSRGLLDDTVVIWTTEFGRMPCSQGGKGRDHNPFAFTSWLAGGGVKGGVSYGASDEWSFRAATPPTYCYDLHATVLHCLGIDHERLTFRHNGIDRRLTDVHGHVIREVLA